MPGHKLCWCSQCWPLWTRARRTCIEPEGGGCPRVFIPTGNTAEGSGAIHWDMLVDRAVARRSRGLVEAAVVLFFTCARPTGTSAVKRLASKVKPTRRASFCDPTEAKRRSSRCDRSFLLSMLRHAHKLLFSGLLPCVCFREVRLLPSSRTKQLRRNITTKTVLYGTAEAQKSW